MKTFLITDDGERVSLPQMSWAQTKQAAAIMDCFGRLIPQEGVDYDVEISFKGENSPDVSMNVTAHTDKGEWWKKYLSEFIKKYPPTVENPEEAIEEPKEEKNEEKSEEKNEPDAVTPDQIVVPSHGSPTHDLEHNDAEVVS